MKVNEAIINFAVYEDGTEYYGQAEVTLPEISLFTESIKGAGISGEYEAPILGHIQSMSFTLNFRTVTRDVIKLLEPRNHQIEIRAAQQERDSVTGTVNTVSVKHVFIAQPKKLAQGKVGVATPADASGEFSTSYFATYINGAKQLEIDIINHIYIIGGVDYLEKVRKAIGK